MNQNIWSIYKESNRGKDAIKLFSFDRNDDALISEKLICLYQKYYMYLGVLDDQDYFIQNIIDILNSLDIDKLFIEENEDAEDFFTRIIDTLEICIIDVNDSGELFKLEKKPLINRKDYKALASIISEISLVLFIYEDLFYFPMLFREQFDVFTKIFDVLNIPFPDMPTKSDKRGRVLFYNDLNKNIISFAIKNNLSREEICACIYDYALILINDEMVNDELPEPTNVWLTGGSKEDYLLSLENPIDNKSLYWTCSENTKRGDIIVMYVRTPFSCIQSIWRADIDGIYTPFNYYNSRTRIINGIVIPRISLNELKSDNHFSKIPITRKNFQGVNGVQFTALDYKELQRILLLKEFDISKIPQLHKYEIDNLIELKNEKDVEDKLLLPLLEKLGFSEKEWERQLSQKAGRKEKVIPDFVFLAKGETHFKNAPMIIEAKFDMSSNIERIKTYNQALSYARIMKSFIFVICDKERIIVYRIKDGSFDRFRPSFEKHWGSLIDEEIFRQLKLIIGAEVIKSLKI